MKCELTEQDIINLFECKSEEEHRKWQSQQLIRLVQYLSRSCPYVVCMITDMDIPPILNALPCEMECFDARETSVDTLWDFLLSNPQKQVCIDHVSEIGSDQFIFSQLIYTALSREEYSYKGKTVDFAGRQMLFVQDVRVDDPHFDFYEYAKKKLAITI